MKTNLHHELGAGDAVRALINQGLKLVPITEAMREKIKACAGCKRRAARLNALARNVNPFAKPDTRSQPPTH